MSGAVLDPGALAQLMPMHVVLSPEGRVLGAGPTLARAARQRHLPLEGMRFFSLARVRRPQGVEDMASLRAAAGRGLRLTLGEDLRVTGIAVPAGEGMVLNLSFGIDVLEAVARHGLTMADFAPTDPTTELLFLAEAHAAMHRECEALTERLEVAHREAEARAQSDPLTGLPNRRVFDAVLGGLAAAHGGCAILSVDLDRFKEVNDRHGHAAGDAVLVATAGRLRAAARRDDVVVRLGGDEFAIVLRGEMPPARLREISATLIRDLERPIDLPGGGTAAISASVGIARSCDLPGWGPAALLDTADAALYRAKRAGRGRAAA